MKQAKPTSLRIFGCLVDDLVSIEARNYAEAALLNKKFCHIVTPNVEFVMQARHNPAIQKLYNEADLHLIDGIGLVWAIRFLWHKKVERIAGADFVASLCYLAHLHHKTVGLVASDRGLDREAAEKAAKKLQAVYQDAQFIALNSNYHSALSDLNAAKIDILLVGFGAPAQDAWISQHKDLLENNGAYVAMGCGASIDFIAGVQKRAPRTWQNLGLEWLWRLLHQPSRLKRQLVIPYFMGLVLLAKLHLIKK